MNPMQVVLVMLAGLFLLAALAHMFKRDGTAVGCIFAAFVALGHAAALDGQQGHAGHGGDPAGRVADEVPAGRGVALWCYIAWQTFLIFTT